MPANAQSHFLPISPSYTRGYAVAVTSGTNTTIIAATTASAGTICVTELLVSANVAMTVDLLSNTATFATVYLAAQGGFVWPLDTPLVLTSGNALNFHPSASGSCSVAAVGYWVA